MNNNQRETERFRIIVFGKVQGVGFRAYTKKIAKNNNLCGWVKNNKDGTVELEVGGKPSQIKLFLDLLEIGSASSTVESIKRTKLIDIKGEDGFYIIRKKNKSKKHTVKLSKA